MNTGELKKAYQLRKKEISGRLSDFEKLKNAREQRIFEELVFCLLTPGANAENCKNIIVRLKKKGLLFKSNEEDLWPFLKYARFYKQKSGRLLAAREIFSSGERIKIKEKVFRDDPLVVRDWLVKHVSGLGYKEASHFLRNVGLGKDLAILDRHILRRLKSCGILKEVPKSLTPKRYLEIEEKMRLFFKQVKIPLDHLDLLFFSMATGKPIKECK